MLFFIDLVDICFSVQNLVHTGKAAKNHLVEIGICRVFKFHLINNHLFYVQHIIK